MTFDWIKRVMGAGPSTATNTPKKNRSTGCWKLRQRIDEEEAYNKKTAKLTRDKLKKIKLTRGSNRSNTIQWEEIPTPSVCEHRDSSEETEQPSPPTQEMLLQIIRCFPFPTPQGSPKTRRKNEGEEYVEEPHPNCTENPFCVAFEKLVQVSVETMAITALPMDVWLKERLKKWVQLSGHEGSIVPASPCTLYKKQATNCSEARAYEAITSDPLLDGCTPKFYKEIQKNEESFIEIEDLLQQFSDPTKIAIMDIKVGSRTFLESEVSNTKKRNDLYQKMMDLDPNEPTSEERAAEGITKLRYMQFRERESSSAQLGFRIEAAKMPGGDLQKNFKKVRSFEDVIKCLIDFFGAERARVRAQLLARLKEMRRVVEKSTFFATHEVVGSSLLIVYDTERVGCWMIDFAKSHLLPEGATLDHRSPWVPGNAEDGYLTGLDNLIQTLEDMPPTGPFPTESVS